MTTGAWRRPALGTALALAALVVAISALVPVRTHVSVATPALVFVLPVVAGVLIGGLVPGVVTALCGFLAFDIYFIPPYGTLSVAAPQDWTALVVYVVVALVVAQVVVNLRRAREQAQRRTSDAVRLFDLSHALIGDLTLTELLDHIAEAVQTTFTPRWSALLLPEDDDADRGLQVAASAGQPLTEADHLALTASAGQTRSLGLVETTAPATVSVALVAGNRPVGLLVLQDARLATEDRATLGTFANQAALALDRARLRDQALRTRLLEEIDRWRGALMGAVSHDLRTPLASVKTAVSSLRQSGAALAPDDRAELLELIELQSDRLARLVTNLLDMTRIESGALELRPTDIPFEELAAEVLGSLAGLVRAGRVTVESPPDLPLLHVDHLLIGQVLANLVENAARLSPDNTTITISARAVPGTGSPRVEIAVEDEGPGIATEDRWRVFDMFSQNGGGGRAGLGLAIAKAFVEAHGGAIWVDPAATLGARVVFTVPGESGVPAHA